MVVTSQELKQLAKDRGIDLLGVCSAEPFLAAERELRERAQRGMSTPFEEADIEKRCYPEKLLPGARSIIAVGLAYAPPESLKPPQGEGPRGRLSCYGWGLDYHWVLRDKMEEITSWITDQTAGGARCESFVDTGPPVDREVARRAGIGWMGKNTLIITPDHGSYVFLGVILTDLDLAADEPLLEDCGDCDLCMQACPTDAIFEPYKLDPNRCIGYLTQMKGPVPRELRPKMTNHLSGCDICQRVCPKNRDILPIQTQEFEPDPSVAYPSLERLLSISSSEFKRQFGRSSAAWRGKKTMQRNAVIALGNLGREEAVPLLGSLLTSDVRPLIRGHAAWALGQIGSQAARSHLEQALATGDVPSVIDEIEAALLASSPSQG